MTNNTRIEVSWTKVAPLLAVTVSAIVAVLLSILASKHIHLGSSQTEWITQNRASTQIIVQLLSMTLGTFQLYAFQSLFRFWISTHLTRKSSSLDSLKFMNAVYAARFDHEIQLQWVIVLLLYLAAVQVPAALWAGALTPVFASMEGNALYTIPAYSSSTENLWGYTCWPTANCPAGFNSAISTPNGTFTYIPWKEKSGLILNSIRSASAVNESVPRYSKLDNTGYTFLGRSYGVASGVGLAQNPTPKISSYSGTLLSYTYQDSGYVATVTCSYNETSDLKLTRLGTFDTPGGAYAPTAFWANGSLPTGFWGGYPTWGTWDDRTILALAAMATVNKDRFMYGLISGSYVPELNQIQCDVVFQPGYFTVSVDTQAQAITVALLNATSDKSQQTPTPGISLVYNAFYHPSLLAQMLTTLYSSAMGNAFWANAGNVQIRNNHTERSSEDWLTSVVEGLELLLDHVLGSLGAAQLVLSNDVQEVPARLTLRVLQLGNAGYTYSILVISIIMLLLAIADAIRTHFWRDLPVLNLLDLKSAILSAAKAPAGSGSTQHDRETAKYRSVLENWGGDGGDRATGAIRVVQPKQDSYLWLLEPGQKDGLYAVALTDGFGTSKSDHVSRTT